jgi:hypothetical protein
MTLDQVTPIRLEAQALVDTLDRDPLVGAVIRGDASRGQYVRFLAGTYHYVRWSGPLLAATAAGLRRSGRQAWLADLILGKADEESPHHQWALEDLRACGEDPAQVEAAGPPIAVRAYVDWSLAMAEAGSPGFLGCAYALELISARRAQAAADHLRARGTIPGIAGAVSFLSGHGAADAAHVALLEEALGRIDDAEDRAAIRLSAAVLRALYPRFFAVPAPAPRPRAAEAA